MRNLLVVGNGMVGQKFLDLLIGAGGAEHFRVTVVGEERRPAYDRVALSSIFDMATEHDLRLAPEDLDASPVEYVLGRRVIEVDPEERVAVLDDGGRLAYDELVLATGSTPFVPPVPGRDLPGCFVYRTLDDLERIRSWAQGRSVGVVIGGGLLGLEAANALRLLGVTAHVVEMAPHLMPRQLDADAGEMLARWITDLGVTVHTGVATEAIEGDESGVTGVRFADGTVVPAELVVFSAGIRPRDDLGREMGLEVGSRGGIVVDDHLRTSVEAVSALGEVACLEGMVYGLVAPGYDQARTLAQRLTGQEVDPFRGADLSTKLKLMGVDVASFGEIAVVDGKHHELVFSDPFAKIHRKLVVDADTGSLVGGMLVGDASGYDLLRMMTRGEVPTPEVPGALVLPDSVQPTESGGLPDACLVCSCNAITAGDLREAVAAGCHSVGALKSETTAGTGCAGCVPMMKTILDAELEAVGIELSSDLCEHFPHSRQDLYDLVRFHRHRTWGEVLAAHGTGLGCEVCRPTVGSILASLAGGYILEGDQAAIQDTNDHVLANMQRNGTYSVVPRVPGGEITADQLMAIARIAKDYDLYVKITGGQRIDLFGAQLHQLPQIWNRVIEAGMESGHAYGKALRTVKSCVGSTWCRYGVQDSVSMAIRLERRYRGLRSPHKIKSAVSGCTRECAEAQSKDFGVIATEKGWNLYVGGNGGKTPRHADLLVSDLDDETLVRIVDRFLMFYVRTADRLERTSTWLERLEGGLDHLRSVIIDDSLGICAELEADMQRHVESYRCEWAETLDDPDRLGRFVEFVNAPEVHSQPVWIESRGQRIPSGATS